MTKRAVTCPSCGNEFLPEEKTDNEQLDELVRIEKPLLIQAGPGSGKTHTLAYKIKHLIKNEGASKDSITVITFTNEAAHNMRKKISEKGDGASLYIEPENQPPIICTIHKFCHKLLNKYASRIRRTPGIQVQHSRDLKDILIKDAAQLVPGGTRSEAVATIQCREKGNCTREASLKCKICARYEKILEAHNSVDFDEQVLLACRLLRDHKDILAKVQNGAKHLLVDEYQDINNAQWELIKRLSGGNEENLFVVGDKYQSIYNYRGGDPKFINAFKEDYGADAEERDLLTNWRCPPNIFKGAYHMVQQICGGDLGILNRIEFKNTSTAKIKIRAFDQQNLEAYCLAEQILELGPSPEVLILVPQLSYAKPIKQQLNNFRINFSCGYDAEKTDLHVVNTLLDWLKKPDNDFFLRVLIERMIANGIAEIPASQMEDANKQISQYWGELKKGKTLFTKVKAFRQAELQKLRSVVIELRKYHDHAPEPAVFLPVIAERLRVWSNLTSFGKEMQDVYDEVKDAAPSGSKGVRIMTMTKAKGLEADHVFIIGAENNVLSFSGRR